MSLDVYLHLKDAKKPQKGSSIFIRENGSTREISREEWEARFPDREPIVMVADDDDDDDNEDDCVFTANITHNLTKMASEAGIYKHLWRPDEIGVTRAEQLISPLTEGLARLSANSMHFRQFNPKNGWGDYEGLKAFVAEYLKACIEYPEAEVRVWR